MIKMKYFASVAVLSVVIGAATMDANKLGLDSSFGNASVRAQAIHGKELTAKIKLSAQQTEMLALIEEVADENAIDGGELAALVWIESRLDPKAKSSLSSASGLCQFISSTGRQYGLTDPFDARANLSACAALWKANAAEFERRVGRKTSGSMQYLMHQQGAGTAVMMVLAGDRLAKTVSSRKAVALNLPGRNPDTITASEFVKFWQAKFDPAHALFVYE